MEPQNGGKFWTDENKQTIYYRCNTLHVKIQLFLSVEKGEVISSLPLFVRFKPVPFMKPVTPGESRSNHLRQSWRPAKTKSKSFKMNNPLVHCQKV